MPLGKHTDEWVVRRHRGGLQGGRARARRDLRRPEHEPPGARAAHGDGLLAERQAVPARLARRARCRPCRRSRAGSASSRRTSSSSASTPAAASAAAFRATSRWRFRRCSRRRPTRRCRCASRARTSTTSAARVRRFTRASRSASTRTAASPPSTSSRRGERSVRSQVGDARSAGDAISLAYQPMAMRWRGDRRADQHAAARRAARAGRHAGQRRSWSRCSPRPARKLGIDEVEIHRINAPAGKAQFGAPAARGRRNYVTSAFVKEALDKGAELFNWEEKKARSGKRVGTKVRGVGRRRQHVLGRLDRLRRAAASSGRTAACSSSRASATWARTAMIDVHRVAAEMLGVPWDQCEVVFGDTSKHLPWTCFVRRQPDDPRDDARGARRRPRRRQEAAAGDRGQDATADRPRATRSPTAASGAA